MGVISIFSNVPDASKEAAPNVSSWAEEEDNRNLHGWVDGVVPYTKNKSQYAGHIAQ